MLAMRRFVGIDLGREPGPTRPRCAGSAICLNSTIWAERRLTKRSGTSQSRLKIARDTIVDATIISAPSSTKNAEKARDPDMHHTKKDNQWYFA